MRPVCLLLVGLLILGVGVVADGQRGPILVVGGDRAGGVVTPLTHPVGAIGPVLTVPVAHAILLIATYEPTMIVIRVPAVAGANVMFIAVEVAPDAT